MITALELRLLIRHIELGDIDSFLSQIDVHWYYNGVSIAESDGFFWDEIRRSLSGKALSGQFVSDTERLILRYLDSHHVRSIICNIELKEALMSISKILNHTTNHKS